MATSSKVLFNLETLKAQAVEAIASRIARTVEDIDAYTDDEAFNASVQEWRKTQEARVADVFRRLGGDDIPNSELADFGVDPMPRRDESALRRSQAELRRLEATRDIIAAKANSLVPDEEGNISLTKTQLSEFFGL